MEIKVSILDYLGKIEKGIIVLISLVYNDKYYEGMFVYTDEQISLSVDDSLELIIGDIKKHKDYVEILKFLIKNVVPWSEMIDKLKDVDMSIFIPITSEIVHLAGNVDPSQITTGTQS